MNFIEQFALGAAGTAFVGLILERARRYWKRADNRQDRADERERKSDQFDSLLSAGRRWKAKARTCQALQQSNAPRETMGYALNDLVNEMDLTEWEPKPLPIEEIKL